MLHPSSWCTQNKQFLWNAYQLLTDQHNVIAQKNWLFVSTAVRMSDANILQIFGTATNTFSELQTQNLLVFNNKILGAFAKIAKSYY